MKQKLSYGVIFCLIGLLIGYVFADVGGWQIHRPPTADWFSGSVGDPAWNWMKAADKLIELGANPGTGKIWYVDSGVTTAGSGNSWESAYATLKAAIVASDADSGDDRGDYFLLAQGHAETFTAADGFDVTVSGATIIGLGKGSLIPTFTMNHADADSAIGADNVTLKNLRFLCSVTGVKLAIDIEAGSDYCDIDGCLFWEVGDATGTDEFLDAIIIGNACIGTTIQNCIFRGEAAGAVSAITSDNDTAFTTIRNNVIVGDYSTGCIEFATVASTDLHILSNILINGDLVGDNGLNAKAAIDIVDATGGFVCDNRIGSDVATGLLMRVADDMVFMNNYITDDDGDEFSGVTEDTSATIGATGDG